jgi:hypothetical protein
MFTLIFDDKNKDGIKDNSNIPEKDITIKKEFDIDNNQLGETDNSELFTKGVSSLGLVANEIDTHNEEGDKEFQVYVMGSEGTKISENMNLNSAFGLADSQLYKSD